MPENINKNDAFNYLCTFSNLKLKKCIYDFNFDVFNCLNGDLNLKFNIHEFESKLLNNKNLISNDIQNDDFDEYLLYLEDF